MSLAASASGRSILIFTSSRPGRRMAGSIMSSRLEAPITMTFSRPSTPSISVSSCGTMVFSTSLDTPEPRVRKIESISSKNTMTGMPSLAFSRARWNTSRMCRSVSPTYLFSSSGPLMLRKKLLPSLVWPGWSAAGAALRAATCLASELATALAISVLPQPGGPYSSTPLGGRSWCSRNRSACRYGSSTASRICSICGPSPPISE